MADLQQVFIHRQEDWRVTARTSVKNKSDLVSQPMDTHQEALEHARFIRDAYPGQYYDIAVEHVHTTKHIVRKRLC